MNIVAKSVTLAARWTAIAGGVVLVALTVVAVASISGRLMVTLSSLHGDAGGFAGVPTWLLRNVGGFATGLGARPIPGDYELIEAGTAFAIFSFLPWCHLNRGHAAVELLAPLLSRLANRLIDVAADALMLAFAVLIAWRHWLGTLDKYAYGETTFILQFPLWWGYAASLVGAAVFIVVCAFCLIRSVGALASRTAYEVPGALP